MKRAIFFLIFVLFVSLVSARNIDLVVGANYLIENKNITLVRLIEDKVLVCVNGVNGVVSKDINKNVNGIRIDLIKIEGNKAKFDFIYNCRGDCVCEEDCDNSVCLKSGEIEIEEIDENEEIIDEEGEIFFSDEIKKEETITNESIGVAGALIAVLVVLVLLLGVIALWKRT